MNTLVELVIRPIDAADDAQVARIIRTVMPEFGADGPGYAIHDAEVDHMSKSYARPRCAYFVVSDGAEVYGGGGVAPLDGGPDDTCELRKMYFLPKLRGQGMGQRMLERCLAAARELGFRRCYLETLERMTKARALYERNGFRELQSALGKTGHFSCDRYYARAL